MLPLVTTLALLLGQGAPPQLQAPEVALLQRPEAAPLQRLAQTGATLTVGAADGDAVTVEARRAVAPAGDAVTVEARPAVASAGDADPAGVEVTLRGTYRLQGGALTILRALPRAVTASTELPPDKGGDHLALRAADERPDTAWCEGSPGAGGDQWIRLDFDEPLPLTGLTLVPGDGRGRSRFEERARPRRVRVFAPPRAPVDLDLQDRPEAQRIPLARGGPVQSILVRVIRVWRGSELQDMCISDLFADGK